MIEPRVYRAAFIPALFALVIAAFSLESRPRPLPQGLAADVLFDGDQAAAAARALAARHPDRRPGSLGDGQTAAEVARSLASRGFRVEQRRFSEAHKDLINVIGRRAGRSRRQIVIVSSRDAHGRPDAAGSASDTAALLELARVFQGRPTRKTLVLASLDGSTLGDAGAEDLAGRLGDPGLVDAVLAISDLGAHSRRGSLIVPWSNDTHHAGVGLQRTVADSIRQELDTPVGTVGALGQLARLAFPIGMGPQGVFLDSGYESVRISGSGELPGSASGESVDPDKLGGLGRAALRTATALDEGKPPARGPDGGVTLASQILPGWVLRLLGFTLLLPAWVAAVDAFARARRRREPVGPWVRWLGVWVGPLVAGLLLTLLLGLVGGTPDPPPAPPAPADYPLDGGAAAVLVAISVVVALLWAAARFIARRSRPGLGDPSAPGAGVALALLLVSATLLLWLTNPFAALVLVPAAHLWLLTALADPPPGGRTRGALVAAGAFGPVLIALYWLLTLRLDPISGAWYLLLLVTGGAADIWTALLGCLLLGAFAATVSLAFARRPEPPPAESAHAPLFGPGSHAGRGALGGTDSALKS